MLLESRRLRGCVSSPAAGQGWDLPGRGQQQGGLLFLGKCPESRQPALSPPACESERAEAQIPEEQRAGGTRWAARKSSSHGDREAMEAIDKEEAPQAQS